MPEGYAASPLLDGDIDAVVALVRACELHDTGEVMFERADLVGDLAVDGMDRALDAIVVRAVAGPDAGRIVAWGMVIHQRSRWADVHPDHRGRGIGEALLGWSAVRARAKGAERIGQTVADNRADAIELFTAHGCRPVRTAWILRKPVDGDAPAPADQPPAGIVLRAATPADEVEALRMLELAFSEWPDRLPATLETWQALVTRRAGFDWSDLQVAVAEDGMIVGAAVLIDDGTELWVDKFATHPQFRGRGIGRALLLRAFAIARERGRSTTALSTDSNTGALAFYERLGMVVERSFTHWAQDLQQDR